MSVSLPHALAVWRRNASMYRRTWMLNILPNFFEPVLYLLSIGIGVGAYITQMGGMSYAAFLAPGLVCVAAMNGASFEVTYNIFVRLNFEKQYDAMLTTPIQPDDVLAGEILWAVTPRVASTAAASSSSSRCSASRRCRGALLVLPVIPLAGPAVRRHRHRLLAAHPDASTCSASTSRCSSRRCSCSPTCSSRCKERLRGSWLWVAEALPLLHPVRLARTAFAGQRRPASALWDVAYILVAVAACCWCGRARRYAPLVERADVSWRPRTRQVPPLVHSIPDRAMSAAH